MIYILIIFYLLIILFIDPTKRELFDKYLNDPRAAIYYEVTGHYILNVIPKANVAIIITVVLCLLSGFMFFNQSSKYHKIIRILKRSLLQLEDEIKKNGSLQVKELHIEVVEKFDELLIKNKNDDNDKNNNKNNNSKKKDKKSNKDKDNKLIRGIKMLNHPLYIKAVDEILDTVEIEGGYRKPTYKDLLIVKLIFSPYNYYIYYERYYRIEILKQEPKDNDEKLLLCIENIGRGTWFNLTQDEQVN